MLLSNLGETPIIKLIESEGFTLSDTEKDYIRAATSIPAVWPHVGAYLLSAKLTQRAINSSISTTRATWWLAGATIALVLATIVLVIITIWIKA